MPAPGAPGPQPGWYPDPELTETQRYWDGERFTENRAPLASPSARDEKTQEAEGTDVTLSVKGRTWVNSDGRRNMPSGEVFTGPHETSANGRIRFGVPSSPAGVEVAGVDLEFRDGLVVDFEDTTYGWRKTPLSVSVGPLKQIRGSTI